MLSNLEGYTNKFRDLSSRITQNLEMMCLWHRNGLPLPYRKYLQVIRSTSLSDLISESGQLHINSAKDRNRKPVHNKTNKHKNDSKRQKFFTSVTCYKCKEYGHTANSCKNKKATKKITAIQRDSVYSDELYHTDNIFSSYDDPNEDDSSNSSAKNNFYQDTEQYSSDTDLKINSLSSKDSVTLVLYVKFHNVN
jgi:Zinc knuckle